jgi:hypothetical protein
MSNNDKVGLCEHCLDDNQLLKYSELYNEWMCQSCWEYTAELYIESGDMHYWGYTLYEDD